MYELFHEPGGGGVEFISTLTSVFIKQISRTALLVDNTKTLRFLIGDSTRHAIGEQQFRLI